VKKIVLFVGALAAVVALSSCTHAPSREEVKAQLEQSGITGPLADCVTDKMIDQFGPDRLGQRGDLTDEEQQALVKIGEDCMGGTDVTTTTL
jgi:hypothetical protein